MGDESDFTFCKVSPDGNDDVLPESPRVILEVGSLSVEGAHVKRDGKTEKGGESSARSSQPEESGEKSGGASSVKSRAVPQTSTRKPVARAKVPYEKGFSQMDWMKLTRTHPDLAGLNGKSNRRMISLDEVRQHKTDGSIWTVLKGRVYNIAPYMKFHPGGPDMLMKAAGKDCTSLFNKYHAWVNSEFLLEKCLVGVLGDSS